MKLEIKEIKPIAPPKEYIVTLDQVEFDVIVALVGRACGYDGPRGYREVASNIYNSLKPHQLKKDIVASYGMHFDGFGDRVAYSK